MSDVSKFNQTSFVVLIKSLLISILGHAQLLVLSSLFGFLMHYTCSNSAVQIIYSWLFLRVSKLIYCPLYLEVLVPSHIGQVFCFVEKLCIYIFAFWEYFIFYSIFPGILCAKLLCCNTIHCIKSSRWNQRQVEAFYILCVFLLYMALILLSLWSTLSSSLLLCSYLFASGCCWLFLWHKHVFQC